MHDLHVRLPDPLWAAFEAAAAAHRRTITAELTLALEAWVVQHQSVPKWTMHWEGGHAVLDDAAG